MQANSNSPRRIRHPVRRKPAGRLLLLLLAGAVWLTAGCGGDDDDNPAITVASTGPNVVSYWDEVAAAMVTAPAAPTDATESERFSNYSADMATLHVAMYDTAIAITGTHQPYKVTPATPANGASTEAAVNAAAYGVLSGLFPNRAALYQTKYDDAQATIPDGAAKAQGVTLGNEVATAILADRANDGRAVVLPPFVPGTLPGSSAASTRSRATSPTSSRSPSRARRSSVRLRRRRWTVRPTPRTSTRRGAGRADSTTRTPEQTEAARFNTEPPPRFWSRNLRQFAMSQPTLAQNARLMAMLYVVQADLPRSAASTPSTTTCSGGR